MIADCLHCFTSKTVYRFSLSVLTRLQRWWLNHRWFSFPTRERHLNCRCCQFFLMIVTKTLMAYCKKLKETKKYEDDQNIRNVRWNIISFIHLKIGNANDRFVWSICIVSFVQQVKFNSPHLDFSANRKDGATKKKMMEELSIDIAFIQSQFSRCIALIRFDTQTFSTGCRSIKTFSLIRIVRWINMRLMWWSGFTSQSVITKRFRWRRSTRWISKMKISFIRWTLSKFG